MFETNSEHFLTIFEKPTLETHMFNSSDASLVASDCVG